jgi:hypothetical protein
MATAVESNDVEMSIMQNENEIVLYQPDAAVRLEVMLGDDTVWLTQIQIANLFGVKIPAVSKHMKNIFESKELMEKAVVSILETTAADGKRYKTRMWTSTMRSTRPSLSAASRASTTDS